MALEGRDVVAMARTGSGKTACFLIPMFEKLKARSAKAGARAMILSPTRELALQTLKFVKELGRFLGLKSAVILGGDSMDDQFSALHGNPDIIVATPGRFLHVCMEMELKLNNIEYVVFDEADRLFEMGLGGQLTEIVNRLPDARQTLLFSATLPKVLVEFARMGLTDPVLLRLDVETKIPQELELFYFIVRPDERVAALFVLLKNCIKSNEQTIVFAATKYHVEYLHMLLENAGIPNTYIYSNLDPSARKINAAKFSTGKIKVLVVTDVAARGIDIPQLDNVINFNFPAKSKLFVHRVGRCARAGRSGTAYSLVGPDEYAHLVDLHLFLGRSLSMTKTGAVGRMPQSLIEEHFTSLEILHDNKAELVSMKKVCDNAYQQYGRTKPAASTDSNRRVKKLPFASCPIHQIFSNNTEDEPEREALLDKMKYYRPHGTIFEICGKNKSQEYQTMKQKRQFHKEKIQNFHQKIEDNLEDCEASPVTVPILEDETNLDLTSTFKKIIIPKKRKLEHLYTKSKRSRRDDNFIPYLPPDRHTEQGLAINSFQNDASGAVLDLTNDSQETNHRQRWDRKKKKMVGIANKHEGKIKTESGVWIPATYKSNRYAQWKEKSKIGDNNDSGDEDTIKTKNVNTHWGRHNKKIQLKQKKSELRNTDQIMKARKLAEKKKKKNKGKKKGGGKRKNK